MTFITLPARTLSRDYRSIRPTPTYLGCFTGQNHPSQILSDARRHSWRDFAVLMVIGNGIFYAWVLAGGQV